MLVDADGPIDADPKKFLNDDIKAWEPAFRDQVIHGVIFITGNGHHSINHTLKKVKKIFHVGEADASIIEITEVEGKVRPGKEEGHEQ